MEKKTSRFPNKLLVIGIVLFLSGGLLLLRTTGYLPGPEALWPLVLLLFGITLLYMVFIKGASEKYIFPGMFLTLTGITFLLISTVLPVGKLERIWPVFMCIAGLSLIPYGLKKRKNARIALIVPGVGIVILSMVFLLFSLDLVDAEFLHFATRWWPALFMAGGAAMVAAYIAKGGTDRK